jgi:hypothetical protein
MRLHEFAFCAFATFFVSSESHAGDYSVFRGEVGAGTCIVQDSTAAAPQYPEKLATKPTLKEACEVARTLKTENPGEARKCYSYVSDTVVACLANGVTLNP